MIAFTVLFSPFSNFLITFVLILSPTIDKALKEQSPIFNILQLLQTQCFGDGFWNIHVIIVWLRQGP